MKFTLALIALAAQVLSATARTAEESTAIAEECGALGVMDIPEGRNPNAVRHCEGHPLGADRRKYKDQSLAPSDQKRDIGGIKGGEIFARKEQACFFDAALGCTNSYCWRQCGSPGQWCWTASGDGSGDWLRCNRWQDCSGDASCGKGCKPGNKACGCSC